MQKVTLRLVQANKKIAIPSLQSAVEQWSKHQIFDIAANLSDERFVGEYYGKKCHSADFEKVIERANSFGVKKFLFAAGHIDDAKTSYDLSLKSEHFYATVGIHPCRALEPYKKQNLKFEDLSAEQRQEILDKYLAEIDKMLENGKEKFVAVGECGLDYDRLEYADKQSQLLAFAPHFDLAQKHKLPMYLHSRATGSEFVDIVKANRHKFSTGVVHSFTGDIQEMKDLVDMDLFIGINGCSMKTEQNCEVVKQVPLDKLMIETDCPYCDIRNSHAGAKHVKTVFPRKDKGKYQPDSSEFQIVKDRNEPCTIVQVVEVIAALKQVSVEVVTQASWENTLKMFNLK